MEVIDTVPYFFDHYTPSVDFLRTYYDRYSKIFEEYFSFHCKDTEERHQQSLSKYPTVFERIKKVHKKIEPLVGEIAGTYSKLYGVTYPVNVHFIVGGFGSNAYTHRMIIPDITFSLEKLSPEENHLRTIIAHEFGHATHNILSENAKIDWTNVDWTSPLTWFNQEGAAIHFSRKAAPHLHPAVYFSFDDEGEEWLNFAEANKPKMKRAFVADVASGTPLALFREWFSINGGKTFGYTRLAYYLADQFFQSQVQTLGEIGAVLAWGEADFKEQVKTWLNE